MSYKDFDHSKKSTVHMQTVDVVEASDKSFKLLFFSFQRGTEKYHEKSDMAAGKGKWGVAYYKQDYPERDLDDDVVRAPYPLASFFHTHKCTHTHY